MKKQKKSLENTQQKKLWKKEQNNQENKLKKRQNKNKIYFGKNANVVKNEEDVEVSVTYEVVENIGMQEKIDKVQERTEEKQ